jgi:hypothetical protein
LSEQAKKLHHPTKVEHRNVQELLKELHPWGNWKNGQPWPVVSFTFYTDMIRNLDLEINHKIYQVTLDIKSEI